MLRDALQLTSEALNRRGPGAIIGLRDHTSPTPQPVFEQAFRNAEGPDTIEYRIGEIFAELKNRIRSGYNLREIIDQLDGLRFGSQAEKHELSQLYEAKIRNMGNAGRNGGEYYTPRPLIRAMIRVVRPTIGERIYDGAVGSAGFLCEVYEHLEQNRGDGVPLPPALHEDAEGGRPRGRGHQEHVPLQHGQRVGEPPPRGGLVQHFTGTGIQHLTGEALHRLVLPIAPLQEMRRLVSQFDALAAETRRLESLYQRKLTALDELKRSILHQAFTGRLTERAVAEHTV